MPKITTAKVTQDELNHLFDEFDIWAKIQDGYLSSEPKPGADTPSYDWPNATSMIIKHCRSDGKHVATTHCIKDNKIGRVLHWDAKDLIVGDVKLTRL